MFQQFYQNHGDILNLPLLSMFIFAGVFFGVVARSFLNQAAREGHDKLAAMPLQDDDHTALESGAHHG